MDLVVVGLNHRTSSVDLRERLAMDLEAGNGLIRSLKASGALAEGMVVSTCNRVEVYAVTGDTEEAPAKISDALAQASGLQGAEVFPALYAHRTHEAVAHLFRVVASLDSLVIGEPQILGQIKQSFAAAQEAGLSGPTLHRILERAFSVAKRVRNETQIARLAVSISSVAVDLARKIFGRLDRQTAMLVGAGEMAELAARHFDGAGVRKLVILNRTYERAAALAQEFGAAAVPFERLTSALADADIAVFSAGATHYLLRREDLHGLMRQRRQRPLFLIDIAVPRNIDPACADEENVFLYDIDDLQQIADENRSIREDEAEVAARIVAEEAGKHQAWLVTRRAFPVIARLTARAEQLRRAELERTLRDLQATPEVAEKLDLMTAALVRKLLHEPIQAVRNAQAVDDVQTLDAVRRLFDLGEEAAPQESVTLPDTERRKA